MTTLSVPDMTCGHCKSSVEAALATLADTGAVTVDLTARTITTSGPARPESLIRVLGEIGFPATAIG